MWSKYSRLCLPQNSVLTQHTVKCTESTGHNTELYSKLSHEIKGQMLKQLVIQEHPLYSMQVQTLSLKISFHKFSVNKTKCLLKSSWQR